MTNHLKTQNPIDVAIDEAGRKANGSVQWLLENRKEMPITYGNRLHFMVCGEEGFAEIAKDIWDARSTVDIVCWGFDPGMELTRGPMCRRFDPDLGNEIKKGNAWPRGVRYGRLLEAVTTRKDNPVTVRLLIWYDARGSARQNNMPGYSDVDQSWSAVANHVRQSPPYANPERHKYCADWWARHLPGGRSGAGSNPRLQVVLRGIAAGDVKAMLAAAPKEEDQPAYESGNPIDETGLLENYPTHHQKPVLIDYAHDGGSKAVGYVMGLNSVTDFWDRTAHEIDDPLRETWSAGNVDVELTHERTTQDPKGPLRKTAYGHTKPYQDYACRVVGPALKRLHENFERGWNLFAPAALQTRELTELPPKVPVLPKNPAHGVQIVRTQPHELDKSIKELYFQATSFARNYIYIENQYFFYPEFARHLKRERGKFCDAWARLPDKPMTDVPVLHLFIVIPHPEDDGMVPRTFDMLTELGASTSMPEQATHVDKGKLDQDYKDAHKGKKGNKVLDRPSLKQLQDTLGLKVSVARLRTSGVIGNQMAYREIYIHSKLMLIDDVFVTLGSANLNQRSMSVDSEINIAATGQVWAADLRERVFELHSGGDIHGSGDRSKVPIEFEKWKGRMDDNHDIKLAGKASLLGFLLPFEDHRATSTMHASVTIPSSDSTALA
ncbi:phospholipase D1/2 [Paraburkholderia sp. BL27I4N3]|uniref:phospholipase D-like domain-containing protein n=1 Tax=Paraburkholderia sp. BL27I4N3 TaxID=1938805 RepID=UPI000E240824|nr:phospholipase D-like domain-containing protein [Paraburkholderia sp. BL27I4N3]REE20027.1 phospholipase D1/2 [Paraburkholderia sp. BL27I4N3]